VDGRREESAEEVHGDCYYVTLAPGGEPEGSVSTPVVLLPRLTGGIRALGASSRSLLESLAGLPCPVVQLSETDRPAADPGCHPSRGLCVLPFPVIS